MSKAVATLRALRLARLGRILLWGHELNVIDVIRLNYCKAFRRLQVTFRGLPLEIVDANSFLGIYEEIFLRRLYDFTSLTDSPLMIDGGANVGLATLFFKMHHPAGRVIAFEPDPAIFECLQKNVASFNLREVELMPSALWNTDGLLAFAAQGGASGHVVTSGSSETVSVPAARLKSWLGQKVDFLKLDVEGAEIEVLEDCAEELRHVERLFVEYHSRQDTEQKLSRILQILTQAGFRYHIHEAFTSPRPFLARELLGGMDLQLNIFAYRV